MVEVEHLSSILYDVVDGESTLRALILRRCRMCWQTDMGDTTSPEGMRSSGDKLTAETQLLPVLGEEEKSDGAVKREGMDSECRPDGPLVDADTPAAEDKDLLHAIVMKYPEFPWWPVLAAAIEQALGLMTLEELNARMMVRVSTAAARFLLLGTETSEREVDGSGR